MRYAICNETFEGWDHERVCRFVAGLGYRGLEIAPFTLARSIEEVSAPRRRELRRQAEEHGLTLLGLHWLLAKTDGLQLTAADAAIRKKTADYLVALRNAVPISVAIFSFSALRLSGAFQPGPARAQTVDYAVDTFRRAQNGIADSGVKLCLEPLAAPEADFINTCAEAVEILDRLAHPNFLLHLDVKAMSAEETSLPDLIRRHAPRIGHFHANDANRRGPGFGAIDFVPILRACRERLCRLGVG